MFSGRCCHQRTKELESSIVGGPSLDVGSPVWLRFELSRPETLPARTNTTASPTVRYGPNAPPHPNWAPSLDASPAAGFNGSRFSPWIGRIGADTGSSKLFRDTSLSKHRVGGVPGQDFPVHGEASLRDRTVPDFVVAPAWPLEVTSMHTKNLLHARGVTGHQKVRMPLSSCWYST